MKQIFTMMIAGLLASSLAQAGEGANKKECLKKVETLVQGAILEFTFTEAVGEDGVYTDEEQATLTETIESTAKSLTSFCEKIYQE